VIDTDINKVYLLGLFIYSIQVTGVHNDKSIFINFIYISEKIVPERIAAQ